jgi:hypothetical protein
MHEGAKEDQTPDSWRRRESGEQCIAEPVMEPPRSRTFEVSRAGDSTDASDPAREPEGDPWMNTEELPTEPKASAAPLSEPPDTLRPSAQPGWDLARDTIPAPPPREDE